MKIEIKCSGCKRVLAERNVYLTFPADTAITIEVKPCNNIDCYDCSVCDELQELKDKVKTLQQELKTQLKGGDSAKPAQPELHESKEDANTKNLYSLPATPDIEIGGTIIPGIKDGSAKGTKAD